MQCINFEEQQLSKLSFGTVQLGLEYGIANTAGRPTQQTANDIIEYLIDSGVNSFDTAVAYGNSEEVLGQALEAYSDIFIISKVQTDLFSSEIKSIVEESLKRLKSNHLFALLLHDAKLLSQWSDMQTEKVAMLINGGMIRYFGVSVYTEREFALALENPMVKIIQIPFNIFDQRAVNGDWFKKARDTGKLLFIRSIFLQGLFFLHAEELKNSLVAAAPFLDKMHRIREKLGLSVSQFAMAYVNSASTDAVLLFGCDTRAQAKENIENFNTLPLIDADMQKEINQFFSEVPATVYNPSQWKVT